MRRQETHAEDEIVVQRISLETSVMRALLGILKTVHIFPVPF